MTPEQGIERLEGLLETIEQHHAELERRARQIQQQWAGLGACGGQRADHAAALLATLVPELFRLEKLCTSVRARIAGWQAYPFDRAGSGGARENPP
jgi:hypothetical protein